MARICLISPGHLSTNPRLVKEAVALKGAGHHVHVVHGRFTAWGAANDPAIASQLGSTHSVRFGPAEAPRSVYLRQTLSRRVSWILASMGCSLERMAEQAHSPVSGDLRAVASGYAADLYIAHYIAALPAAAAAAKLHGALYAFDAEDFHLGDLPDSPEHALEKRIIRTIEARYLPGASFVTAASPMIAESYAEIYPITRPTTILNVFPLGNAPSAPTPKGTVTPGPSVYWFSQTIGPGRGLETALDAIARTESRPHLYVRGMTASGYTRSLRMLAAQFGVDDRLHLLDPAAPHELERLGATYDVGLVSELAETRSRDIALTNKLFSYLLGGIPSLASETAAHRRIAIELGAAITLFPIANAAALAASIDASLLDPARLAANRAHAWQLGQERFNWDVESSRILALVDAALNRRIPVV